MLINGSQLKLPAFMLGLSLAGFVAGAGEPDAEFIESGNVPTTERLDEIHASGQQGGWSTIRTPLRDVAHHAFASDRFPVAAAWLGVHRWAALLSQTEDEFTSAWIEAVKLAGVNHTGMATEYLVSYEPLSSSLSPECQNWVIRRREFTEEFFSLLQPVDYVPEVFRILSELHRHDASKFETYASLALAIALVYDVPPPPDWPHGQVSSAKLKRQWPDPKQTFDWLVKQDELGRTQHSLRRLRADELKFVVDLATPLKELEWAQASVNLSLNQLERAYSMVPYSRERETKGIANWAEDDYALKTILEKGGICVDQAYFANAVGKARGVPTLLFRGVGESGRHAWFGFLGTNQQWQLNAGRYAEQRYVTGFARDPQTWRFISDHELKLLSERFRSSPAFRHARVLTDFARDYLKDGNPMMASRAARKAVNYDRRNPAAWDILLEAEVALGAAGKKHEATLREAMLAFGQQADLEVIYSRRISASLRARGEASAADFEARRIKKKHALERTDLNLRHAREALWRTDEADADAGLIRNFNATVDRMGPGAGIAFFDEIVVPVVDHLGQKNKIADAERALERAHRTLRVESGSQLEQEFTAARKRVKALRK